MNKKKCVKLTAYLSEHYAEGYAGRDVHEAAIEIIEDLRSQVRKSHEIAFTYYGGCKCGVCRNSPGKLARIREILDE